MSYQSQHDTYVRKITACSDCCNKYDVQHRSVILGGVFMNCHLCWQRGTGYYVITPPAIVQIVDREEMDLTHI